jgi:hypothetical protein
MVMKSSVFYDISPCSPLKIIRCFEEIRRLHLQGRRISQTRNWHIEGGKHSNQFAGISNLYWKQETRQFPLALTGQSEPNRRLNKDN